VRHGKRSAPRWHLTELGDPRLATDELKEKWPTRNFMRWDGTPFVGHTRASRHRITGDGSLVATETVMSNMNPSSDAADSLQ
jgi:hypothetical protein